MLGNQLGRNMEAYIDDMVVNSKVVEDYLTDLTETFEVLKEYRLKLNAAKCVFGVGSGKFLKYLITHRGIEVNPPNRCFTKLETLKESEGSTMTHRDEAALNCFISKFVDKCRPFFQLLKKWKDFQWIEECQRAFSVLKRCFSQAPILSDQWWEKLCAYIWSSLTMP